MNIRFAKRDDEIALKQLFLNCFDDTLGFVNMFFAHHFVPENTLVAQKNGKAIGLLFLLPCSAMDELCYYVYGVCVAPNERGAGIGSALISHAAAIAKSRGARVILKPENRSLFAFYEKAGFSPCAYLKEESFAGGKAAELLDVTAEEYCSLRSRTLQKHNPILWDESAVDYALTHETFFGGRAFKYRYRGSEGIALFAKSGADTILKETDAEGEALAAVAAAGQKIFGGDSVLALLPAGKDSTPYAVGIGFREPVYLGLMLD